MANRTHCKHGHELTTENSFISQGGIRCRICVRKSGREHAERKSRAQGILPRSPWPDRFWNQVLISPEGREGCWLWQGKLYEGYGRVKKPGIRSSSPAHRVAWELCRGEIPEGLLVCHDCPGGDNPACCNPDHLFLGTEEDNRLDMYRKGRWHAPRGEENGRSRLTRVQVVEIRALYVLPEWSEYKIADRFGISRASVGRIAKAKDWKWLGIEPLECPKNREKHTPRGASHGNAKISNEQACEIRRRYSTGGVTQAFLAAEYGIDPAAISRIVNNKAYVAGG
jgi:hypothetical protein